jgi:hypothetical protein
MAPNLVSSRSVESLMSSSNINPEATVGQGTEEMQVSAKETEPDHSQEQKAVGNVKQPKLMSKLPRKVQDTMGKKAHGIRTSAERKPTTAFEDVFEVQQTRTVPKGGSKLPVFEDKIIEHVEEDRYEEGQELETHHSSRICELQEEQQNELSHEKGMAKSSTDHRDEELQTLRWEVTRLREAEARRCRQQG